jgi:hypothetical protein
MFYKLSKRINVGKKRITSATLILNISLRQLSPEPC